MTLIPNDDTPFYTCGYCGKVMTWLEHQEHNIQDDYNAFKAKYPNYKGSVWLGMIKRTLGVLDLPTNDTNIIYTKHYKSRQ